MGRVHYNRGDEIVEITIRDTSGARMEVRRCNITDEIENGRWLKWLIQKWGVKFKIEKSFMDVDNSFLKF